MKYLVIIPARGGSKGIKDKNIAELAGEPLLSYALVPALKLKESGLITEAVVSTDSEKIAAVAARLGAKPPFLRPAAISGDKAKSVDLILHAINFFEKRGQRFDAIILLQPTSPLRSEGDVRRAIALFEAQGAESLISAYCDADLNDAYMYHRLGDSAEPVNAVHNTGSRRQDAAGVYIRNGAIYITSVSFLKRHKRIFTDKPLLFEMPKARSINLDSPRDLEALRPKFARIGILEGADFSPRAIQELHSLGKVEIFSGENMKEFLSDKEALFIRLKHFIGSAFLEKTPALRFVCTPTTGLNHLDLPELSRRGVEVISLKGESGFLSDIRATPEHTFGLVMALLRRYKDAFLHADNSAWEREKFKGEEIFGKKVGLVGLGRVGKILARYFQCFGAQTLFFDPDRSVSSSAAQRVNSLDGLIERCEIVIVCAAYSEQNKGFFSRRYIKLLKDKYFINTARGELLDEEAFLEKIKAGYFRGVALDVLNNETGPNNLAKFLKLTSRQNLIITPHIAGATYESMRKTEEFIAEKLFRTIRGVD